MAVTSKMMTPVSPARANTSEDEDSENSDEDPPDLEDRRIEESDWESGDEDSEDEDPALQQSGRTALPERVPEVKHTVRRRQFHVRLDNVMTINKSQGGQTLDRLPKSVFGLGHEQLYVALSRSGNVDSTRSVSQQSGRAAVAERGRAAPVGAPVGAPAVLDAVRYVCAYAARTERQSRGSPHIHCVPCRPSKL